MQVSRLALAAAVLLLASCGQCGGSGPANIGGQHLVFTGPAAGTLTDLPGECDIFTASTQYNASLRGTFQGKDFLFNIQVNSGYKGPGDYPVGSILDNGSNLRLQLGDYVGSSASGAGSLTVNQGERTGSVDADLTGGEHVKGTFSCEEVKRQ